jgi:Ca2+-transporting ATPase
LTGDAQLLVALTGGETLYGEIVRSATRGPTVRTPLQSAIASLVTALVVGASVVCIVLAVVRLWQGHGWVDALLSAVTLAVAAIPEEFPVVFTFFLGVGVHRLAKKKDLVRRAVSVDKIGRVTKICSDKTGTITEGTLRVGHIDPSPGTRTSDVVAAGAIASRAATGDPLDLAILAAATTAGGVNPASETLATFPFTEDRRRETGVVRLADGSIQTATKGSPELVLALCGLSVVERAAWIAKVDAWASEGHKVIAVAARPLVAFDGGEPDRGYRFSGLLVCEDPVRSGVIDAIGSCRQAGIHAIMVTGDHPRTAAAIAREIGLGGGTPSVVSGDEMEALAARDLAALRRIDVVARAVPMQKLTLVRALQQAGEIVAVTGDGVNDVPALGVADVGIAMGGRGTRSAREIAAVVLLDDNFRTIVAAIAEGRGLFDNLRLAFAYLLVIHLPLVLSAAALQLAGFPLLYLPIHIVWLELLIHPTAMLVFQDLPQSGPLAPPRRGPARFFSRREGATIFAAGLLVSLAVIAGYLWSLGPADNVEHARAMALLTLTSASAAVTVVLSGAGARAGRVMIAASLLSALAVLQLPVLARLFHVAPLHLDDWALALATSSIAALPLLALRPRGGRRHASGAA